MCEDDECDECGGLGVVVPQPGKEWPCPECQE